MAVMDSFAVRTEGDYMNFLCEKCGDELDVEYLGLDGGSVPHFKISCHKCKLNREWKVMPHRWRGFPPRSD